MTVAVALDLLVAGLLVATIAYAIVLNRRLGQLRGGSAQMAQLIDEFYQATTRVEAGVAALKAATGRDDGALLDQLAALGKMRDELDELVARAETQRTHLSALAGQGRGAAAPPAAPAAAKLAPDEALDAELFGDAPAAPGRSAERARPRSPASTIQETP